MDGVVVPDGMRRLRLVHRVGLRDRGGRVACSSAGGIPAAVAAAPCSTRAACRLCHFAGCAGTYTTLAAAARSVRMRAGCDGRERRMRMIMRNVRPAARPHVRGVPHAARILSSRAHTPVTPPAEGGGGDMSVM
eukprot:1646944-Prymnesium_polylepis.1